MDRHPSNPLYALTGPRQPATLSRVHERAVISARPASCTCSVHVNSSGRSTLTVSGTPEIFHVLCRTNPARPARSPWRTRPSPLTSQLIPIPLCSAHPSRPGIWVDKAIRPAIIRPCVAYGSVQSPWRWRSSAWSDAGGLPAPPCRTHRPGPGQKPQYRHPPHLPHQRQLRPPNQVQHPPDRRPR